MDRTPIARLRSYLLFLDLYVVHKGRPLGPAGLNQIRTVITEALRAKTADLARPYHLRHTLGTRAQLDIGLGLRRALSQTRPRDELQIDKDDCLRCRLPVDAARIMGHFGHARFKTTNRSYGHLPWAYLYPQARNAVEGLDERSGYYLLGKQERAANRAMHRTKEDGLLARLVKRMSNHRTLKKRRRIASASPVLEELPTTLPPAAVYLIDMARQGGVKSISYTISDEADQAYRRADQLVAACTGISFIDPALRQTGFRRLYSESVYIFNLAHAVSKRPAQLHEVLRSFLQLADREQPSRVRLQKEATETLTNLSKHFSTGLTLRTLHEDSYKLELKASDNANRNATPLIAWMLSLCAVLMHGRSELDSQNSWRRRTLF